MKSLVVEVTDLIALLIVYQGVLFLINLFSDKSRRRDFNMILGALILNISLNFLNILLYNQQVTFINFGPVFGLLYGPLCWLYVRALIYKDYRFKKAELLHFLPAFLVLVLLHIIPGRMVALADSFEFLLVVILHVGAYLTMSFLSTRKFARVLKEVSSEVLSINLSWLRQIILGFASIFLIVLAEGVFENAAFWADILVWAIFIMVLVFMHLIYWKGIRQPLIFSGPMEKEVIRNEGEQKYSQSGLDQKLAQQYLERLKQHMEQERSYLTYHLSIEQLSSETGINMRHISQAINQLGGQNFYDFVNHYRLEHAKALLLDVQKNLRINEVMYDSGFSSKSSFNEVFKKSTGLSPSAYRQKHRNK